MDILTPALEADSGSGRGAALFLDYLHPGDAVLCLACGEGSDLSEIARRIGPKGEIFALESAPDRLAQTARQAERCEAPVHSSLSDYLDLEADLEQVNRYLASHPIRSAADLQRFAAFQEDLRRQSPLHGRHLSAIIADGVFSGLGEEQRASLLADLYHRLKRGGRILLYETVSDEPLPAGQEIAPWQELKMMRALEQARFYGIHLIDFPAEASSKAENGAELRRVAAAGYKGKEGPCLERYQAVIYKGPWKSVSDDDGHILPRGERIAVCNKTYDLYAKAPYKDDLVFLPSAYDVPLGLAGPFDCSHDVARDPRETKGNPNAILPITIYTKQGCPSCASSKACLDAADIRYTEVDVTGNNKGGQFHPFDRHAWPYRARQQAPSCDIVPLQVGMPQP
ncbi:MAG: hypothetical protein IT210_04940 [Armatimonadetes bacterium]|nr:hypothetical protein [Armatimonadota bacterium]